MTVKEFRDTIKEISKEIELSKELRGTIKEARKEKKLSKEIESDFDKLEELSGIIDDLSSKLHEVVYFVNATNKV